mmetsp:Transcript_117931/g.263675  ORF Transcript_117931/g.263675 Transcript_117931/m.263675 type:complete len:208 (-) Transcript_117931:130-753(-)
MPRRARSVPHALFVRANVPRLSDSFSDTISEASSGLEVAPGAAALGGALKVIGRRCLIFERPGRSDIRRVAAWDAGLHERSFSASRTGSGRSSAVRSYQMLACGLGEHEVYDLLYRDITPEDYDMLLKLDEMIPKKTASVEALDRLQSVASPDRRHEACGVCLAPFEAGDDVVAVPCPACHEFHRDCVSRWLTQCKNSCPVDHAELW